MNALVNAGVNAGLALAAVAALFAIAFFIGPHAPAVFYIAIPYASMLIFLLGIPYQLVFKWGKAPVPFPIATTCGQQKSLSWINSSRSENPSSRAGVILRMALGILLFRSLLRTTNSTTSQKQQSLFTFGPLLWILAVLLHYSILIVSIRHLRFFFEPVPSVVLFVQYFDSFFDIATPALNISGVVLILASISLLIRRLLDRNVRYISLPSDYFPLFLIIAIASTGVFMRYFANPDATSVKDLVISIVSFRPLIPSQLEPMLTAHIFLVCVLIAYLPFSKLSHMAGVFLSPTRNMRCNTREYRHINPWNAPTRQRPYSDYENEFRETMLQCDLPVDSEKQEGDPRSV
ncbi:MAG: sulfate reduction electron transfer complex DsrMKJOP subunit DsrM [Polyangiaceae bacterium]|nr:sulfate reduction electron transfer complex DsrMKJOP subunit DsrM [Polyangiaceae bacterium]